MREGGEEARRDADEHERRESRLDAPCETPAPEAYHARHDHHADGQQHLAEVDVESGESVVPAELQHVAEHVPDEQHERRGVGPEYRHVGKRKRPGGQEAVVRAERLRRERAGSGRSRT